MRVPIATSDPDTSDISDYSDVDVDEDQWSLCISNEFKPLTQEDDMKTYRDSESVEFLVEIYQPCKNEIDVPDNCTWTLNLIFALILVVWLINLICNFVL